MWELMCLERRNRVRTRSRRASRRRLVAALVDAGQVRRMV